MTLKDFARDEKIASHCGVLAETIVSIRKIYLRAQKQQRAFLETMIGAALWYIPKPMHAWTGCISVEALKSFHLSSGVPNPKFSEEHIYPRKVAARLLLEDEGLDGAKLLELFNAKFGRLHYVTPHENKAVIRFQKDSIFTNSD